MMLFACSGGGDAPVDLTADTGRVPLPDTTKPVTAPLVADTARKSSHLSGVFASGSRTLEILDLEEGWLKVNLCFASEKCMMPCIMGKVKRSDEGTYEGILQDDAGGLQGEKIPVILSATPSGVRVAHGKGPQPVLGANCSFAGEYLK